MTLLALVLHLRPKAKAYWELGFSSVAMGQGLLKHLIGKGIDFPQEMWHLAVLASGSFWVVTWRLWSRNLDIVGGRFGDFWVIFLGCFDL